MENFEHSPISDIESILEEAETEEGANSNDAANLTDLRTKRKSRWQYDEETGADNLEEAKRQRKSRWQNDNKAFIPGMPHLMPANMTTVQEKAYLLQLEIEELTHRMLTRDWRIPADPKDRSPSPEPVYNEEGLLKNSRKQRILTKLRKERHELILTMTSINPDYKPPTDYRPLVTHDKIYEKVLIPQDEHPQINFFGLLVGPSGHTLKSIENSSHTKIVIRGKGSARSGKLLKCGDEPLHAFIAGNDSESMKKAVDSIQEIINLGIEQPGGNALKQAQLQELAFMKASRILNGECTCCGSTLHKISACPNNNLVTNNIVCANANVGLRRDFVDGEIYPPNPYLIGGSPSNYGVNQMSTIVQQSNLGTYNGMGNLQNNVNYQNVYVASTNTLGNNVGNYQPNFDRQNSSTFCEQKYNPTPDMESISSFFQHNLGKVREDSWNNRSLEPKSNMSLDEVSISGLFQQMARKSEKTTGINSSFQQVASVSARNSGFNIPFQQVTSLKNAGTSSLFPQKSRASPENVNISKLSPHRLGLDQHRKGFKTYSEQDSFDLLVSVSTQMGTIGPALIGIIKRATLFGTANDDQVTFAFQDPENKMLLKLGINKLKKLVPNSGPHARRYHTTVLWLQTLLEEAEKFQAVVDELNDSSDGQGVIDTTSIAKATLDLTPSETLEFIRDAMIYEGMSNTSTEEVNKIYRMVSYIHFKMVGQ